MAFMLAKRIFWCVAATLCLVAPACSCEGKAGCETCAADGSTDAAAGAPDSARIDATAAQFLGGTSVNEPVYIGGGTSLCWSGSQICGQWPPSTPWSTMHDAYGVLVKGSKQPSITLERLFAFNHGDGISFD